MRLPAAGASPESRRVALFTFACPALAAWSLAVQPEPAGVLGALLAWQLLLLAALDAEHFWLPRLLTGPLIASGLLVSAARGMETLIAAAIGAVAGFAALSLLAWAYRRLRGREGLGGGDAWLLAGGGAWIGWMALPGALIYAAAGGLLAVGVAAALGRRPKATQPLPFGVALAVGIWIVWLHGPIGGR
ncbi:A24 family peptidase [Phenylobacterium sp. J367]|uniref:prepilin peptidase n=1 Tax=Phenylobacterium sp. J367 TaxID=2898435 RepID=UPI0021510B12|nr:A24 family peptidase [Phenylobacterium sp. J367]MCR5881087.1 A24 family peptidase [Phenylobacterium sp. J367]